MTIFEFVSFPKDQQEKKQNCYGSFVAERSKSLNRFFLYVLGHFCVGLRLIYSEKGESRFVLNRVFHESDYLEPYVEKNDISSLIAEL